MNALRSLRNAGTEPYWTGFIVVSAVALIVLGIENALERKLAFVIFLLLLLYAVAVQGFSGVGLSRRNGLRSMMVGVAVGIVYGTIRGLTLSLLPASALVFGADLARISPRLATGITVGPLLVTRGSFVALWFLMLPFMLALELYFRGVVFLYARRHVRWEAAVAVASTVQALSRRTPHSLIMGSIAGVLMQKEGNVLAPVAMHAVQFLVALGIVLCA